ncbi:ankyrin repeat domain-containing protein 26 isoform X2 [Trichomycterus rosablanca]|uniref:ankyrin repeat domain-containing protein 26 isoform X2 n=1 Tax=Trichomycterus rosablanca TaxID=2290929 RepID=UPI002F34FDC5
MKKIFNFSKKQKDSPSTSETGSALSAGYALKEKDLSKVHKAAFTGDVAKLKQLAKKNDLNQLDKENRTALHIACAHGHAEAVRFLVEKKVKLNLCDNQNRSALMKAVQCQQDRCVTILLEHEADPNLVDLNGNTALHLAARIPSIPVALQLLEHEANINARNKEGNTPLILSVEENHADMAEFLLKEGADVNIKNQEQRSSLLIAACNGHINMVRLLLQFNADITVKDKKGWTSDDYAVMNGHHACSHLIIEHGTKRKQLQSPAHLPSGKKKPTSLLSSPEAGFAIRGPALDKDAAEGSTKEAGKDAEDSSLAGSISRASRSGAADSWPSSDDDDELDLSPKKPQKVNLKKLIHASKKEGNTVTNQDLEKYWSGTDSEPISEDNAAEQLICPASISSSQHPVNPTPTSYNNLPQMMSTSLVSSQKEREKSSSEDEYEEEDEEECDEAENQRSDEEVEFTQKAHTSKDKQRELGFEKDNGEESPWDSESGSDSPRKRDQSGVNIPAKLHKAMASICEKTEEERSLEEKDDDEEKPEMQQKLRHREPVSVLSKMLNSKQNETKRDFLEELGLGDVDDLEDASDWDSASTTSKASKNILITNPGEELAGEHLLVLPVVQEQEPPTSSSEAKEEEKSKPSTSAVPPLPSPRSFIPITHAHPQPKPQLRSQKNKEPNSDEESDWDTDSTSSPLKMTTPPSKLVENKAVTPVADKANLDNSEHSKKDEVAKADVMKGRHKTLGNNLGSGRHTDCDQGKSKKADTNTEQPKPQQEESCDGGSTQKDEGFKTVDSISPEGLTRLKSSPPIHSIDGKTAKEDDETSDQCNLLKVPAPKKSKAVYHVNHRNGKSGLDDSTLSEVSDDELRPASRQGAEKVPVQRGGEPELADDFDDLTQSSDTATDELDSAVPGYIHASLLLKQLDTCILDSVSMVKLQNMFHEYDRTIQKERSRHGRLTDKVSQLEQERNEVKLLLKESKESKSSLEGVRLELETELNHLKFMLKQEQEKHHGASILCEKVREQLRRKEEEQQAEMEEHHKMELKIRSLELEIRGLMNNMKQMEEDRNEAQRLVAHERSARALQEDLMNSHLRKQQDFEEKHLRNVNKSNELPEASEREKELQHLVTTLQEELSLVRAELERSRTHSLEEESRLADERDALQERLDDARRDLKLNEESLAQTVLQYNGQISTLKSECTLLSSKLEHERQLRQQVEAEAEASRARLQSALEETEKCQVARADAERTLQRERDKHQRAEEKWASESRTQGDTVQSLSQKLSEAEARSNNLENDCHRAMLSIAEKTVLVETASRECQQFRSRIEKLEGELQSERERSSSASGRHDAIQERLAQMQSENALLRQHLEEAQNRGTAKEQAVTDAQERFTQALNQLRADGEERVQLVEERSKELVTKNTELREHNYKLEQEKAERESSLRQLQQELADSLKKLAMCEASLEVNTRYRSELVEEKGRTQKEMDRLRAKFQDSEELYLQAERRINTLKGTLDEKERDLISASQKLQEALAATGSTEQTIKQLEEAVQSLEIENARLEATIKQQNNRIEILQKEAQEATAIRHQLEDLVTNLQSSKMGLQDQLSHEMQKQNVLTNNAQDSQALWEDELKSRSRISLRLAELEKEKGEFNNQIELQKKKAKKIAEQKRAVDARLDQEIQRNTELQKETYRLRTLVKTAKKKLREKDGGELDSSVGSPRREPSLRHSETEEAVSRMKIKVDGLHVQLEREVLRCSHLEKVNRELKEQLGSLKSFSRSQERLERSKQQLEEEVVDLRRRLEGGVMDYSQAEQFRRQTEERARQEIQHKLDEVNLFLQIYLGLRYDKAGRMERRQMVQDEIRVEVEENRRIKMVAMYQQGAWTRWEHAEKRKITWPELWRLEPQHLKFLILAVYDVLPSPTNLQRWGMADTAACQLCERRATLEHILSCCPKALGEGRYRWRHDQVLRALADTLSIAISNCRYQPPRKKLITFVRAGEQAQHQPGSSGGLLTTARDWELQVDLGKQLKFPEHILATALRPDVVLTSESTKQVVLVELTVPWEDRVEEANERKRAKYSELVAECRSKGWKARCEPVEVGCRGFAGQSLPHTLKLLGVKGQLCRKAIRNIIEAAEKASRWLWIRRGDPWSSRPLGHKLGADHPRLGRPSEGV